MTIEQLAKRLHEPAWVTDRRRQALAAHQRLPWPHPSDEVWRRTDVSLLDPARGFSLPPETLFEQIPLEAEALSALTRSLGEETLIVRANGSWLTEAKAPHFTVEELSETARRQPELITQLLDADGLTEAEQKLVSLNTAWHHDDVVVDVPSGVVTARPVRLVHLFCATAKQLIVPLTIIRVGAGSVVTLIDEYASVASTQGVAEPHLIHGRIELLVGQGATVHYIRLQRWDARAREFLFQRATLAQGAQLTMANINLGASLSKAHLVTRFTAPHASSKLYGFVFGSQHQHIDQHTLQDHQAPSTTSDLQFKAALQDESRMIYTGLIRIAQQAKQTNAYQSNHNLLLSQGAQAETIPMLEILADDVQCKHGASIGPIDEEQAFYLMSRGVSRSLTERLIVMGFVEPIVQQVPFAPLQERLREEIEGGLRGESAMN